MAETMVTRMAKAMDPECFDPEVERVYGDLWAFEKQAKMRALAIAVLKAMREPTKEMVVAGDDEKENCIDEDFDSDADGNRTYYTHVSSDLAARVFRSMIDAALNRDTGDAG